MSLCETGQVDLILCRLNDVLVQEYRSMHMHALFSVVS